MCPDADYLYACDPHWWRVNHAGIVFHGERWTQRQRGDKDPNEAAVAAELGLNVIEGEDLPGLGKDRLRYGGNSGYQAINLAYLWGAKRILLLGFDMMGKGSHFFGTHPKGLSQDTNYAQFLQHFPALAADLKAEGVEVWNCTRETALRCFPQATMDDFHAV